jgi:hypothetical protein
MNFNPFKLIPDLTPLKPASFKRLLLPLCLALAVSASMVPHSPATELPSGVLNYLRHKDPHVKVRFDGVVVFSNGETYVPVLPQDPSLNPDSQQVVAAFPEKAAFPDLIQFDNNFFLMRLIQTASGRLTFPKMAAYPLQLKEGMLPQDFVLPDNLFIPVELKVILGSLPYNPSNKTPDVVPAPVQATSPLAANNSASTNVYQLKSTGRLTYVFDLVEQKLIGIDAITGHKQGDVALDCVPSSLKLSGDGKLLFAPCLSTNELVVVDTGSNLVKTRVPVGQRPDAVLYLDESKEVVVSNRFSPFLSLISSEELIAGQRIDLPGNGGAMVRVPGGKSPQLAVADAFKAQVYLVDMTTRAVIKTLKAVPDITALRAYRDADGRVQIWAASRTESQLALIDAEHDKILKTLTIGAKPVDMADFGDKLYVVCAGASRVDVVHRPSLTVTASIPLDADAFPSGIAAMADEKRALIVTAAANNLVVLNLAGSQVENTFPVEFRANMIATVPDKIDFVPEAFPQVAETNTANETRNKSKRQDEKPKATAEKPQDKGRGKAVSPPKEKARRTERSPNAEKAPVTVQQTSKAPAANQSTVSKTATPAQTQVEGKAPQAAGNNASAAPSAKPAGGIGLPLSVESPGKFRLILGGGQKVKTPSSLNSTPVQPTKAGVRLPDPKNAPEPATSPQQSPADDPNSMLMMAPDVEK